MLVPDASFAAKETALRTLVRQHGEPRIVSADNLPSGVEGYGRVMPTSLRVAVLKEDERRMPRLDWMRRIGPPLGGR